MRFGTEMSRVVVVALVVVALFLTASVQELQAGNRHGACPDAQVERKFQYYFLEALRQRSLKNYDAAADNLLRCLSLDPTKSAVYSELANINISVGKNKLAKSYMLKAVSLDPRNVWTNQVLAQLYTDNNEFGLAANTFENILKSDPENADYYYYMLAQIYTQTKEYDKALQAWEGLEEESGVNDRITMEKFKIHILGQKEKKAFDEVDKLIKAYPKESKFRVLKGDLYQAVNKNRKAEKTYKSVLKQYPGNAVAKTQLAILYISTRREAEGMHLLKSVLNDPGADLEVKKKVLTYVAQDSAVMNEITDKDFLNLIEMHPNEEFPYMVYSTYLLDQKNPEAFKYMRKALDINPKFEDSWNLLVDYGMMRNDTMGVYNTCNEALEHFPNNANFHYTLGLVYQSMDKKDSTIVMWNKAVELLKTQNLPLASVIQGSLGDIYASMGRRELAYAAYDSAIVLDGENTMALNNYAYALAVDGKELQKAERMSGITVQANPKSATFLDTYAWVYFKQGNYLLAMMYIEQAFANGGGENAEMLEHYGDILYMNGDKEKASGIWKRAYELRKENNLLIGYDGAEKLKQKIDSGSYVE